MPAPCSYDYAILRVVPRVERGEFLNVGAILFCRTRRFLRAQIEVSPERLRSLAPDLDLEVALHQLEVIPLICQGGPAGGPIGLLSQAERFHWLVAPRSTVIQTSPVHSGLCTDPAAALEELMDSMVRIPPTSGAIEADVTDID